ncbi:MAG TPA: MBL fold metallo-hydrolase [Micromonosporaceae bacterium]|jgi:glyoxylase-like metal-dependent hydrolase (beta-lactamase superfamily II)
MAIQIADHVYRLGDRVVNFYLVDHPDGLTLIDAGLPGHFGQLESYLAASGRSVSDITSVLITHGHPDHIGLAARLHAAGATVWVHERDAIILTDGPRSSLRHVKPERSMIRYLLRRPAAIATPLHIARNGGFTAPKVTDVRTFRADERLEAVPGRPRAVMLPGHTPGSAGYLYDDLGVLFTGDALVTEDGLTGHVGPTLVCRGFTNDSAAALATLDDLAGLHATMVLTGHGQPFHGSPAAAAEQARRAGQQ